MAKVGGHILHMSKICSSELTKQISCESSENHLQKNIKTDIWLILVSFRIKKDPKILSIGTHILQTSKSSSNGHVNPMEIFCKIGEKLTFDLI